MGLSTKFQSTNISFAVESDGTIFSRNLHLINDFNSEPEQGINLMTCGEKKKKKKRTNSRLEINNIPGYSLLTELFNTVRCPQGCVYFHE